MSLNDNGTAKMPMLPVRDPSDVRWTIEDDDGKDDMFNGVKLTDILKYGKWTKIYINGPIRP